MSLGRESARTSEVSRSQGGRNQKEKLGRHNLLPQKSIALWEAHVGGVLSATSAGREVKRWRLHSGTLPRLLPAVTSKGPKASVSSAHSTCPPTSAFPGNPASRARGRHIPSLPLSLFRATIHRTPVQLGSSIPIPAHTHTPQPAQASGSLNS